MIILASLLLWGLALAAHALLQPKMLRTTGLPILPGLPLHLCRLSFPPIALWLCWKLGAIQGLLTWLGTGSVAGVLACLALTGFSVHLARQEKRAS